MKQIIDKTKLFFNSMRFVCHEPPNGEHLARIVPKLSMHLGHGRKTYKTVFNVFWNGDKHDLEFAYNKRESEDPDNPLSEFFDDEMRGVIIDKLHEYIKEWSEKIELILLTMQPQMKDLMDRTKLEGKIIPGMRETAMQLEAFRSRFASLEHSRDLLWDALRGLERKVKRGRSKAN